MRAAVLNAYDRVLRQPEAAIERDIPEPDVKTSHDAVVRREIVGRLETGLCAIQNIRLGDRVIRRSCSATARYRPRSAARTCGRAAPTAAISAR